ncbi:protein FAM161A isoform X2 [Echinops telfairi]|uniref:Protein FAM161A isoform X2 n=1 Tax=Echinops telfairi TaxID=9371 RepID=A0AC55DEF8_ECHTE|nr:protein FAM161A isoform X2 [Echinops telfairi]
MDASHREAKLVASSHQIPVHPTTGARVAQYERKDLLEALAAAAAQVALEEAKEEMQPRSARASADVDSNFSGMGGRKHVSQENMVNFSDVHHSNAEYFRKLKELKAAHVETMAKLEKMYQNKLNLKGIQPVIIRENDPRVSSRSGSEKASYPPVTLMPSPSELDVGQSSSEYASSSEEELPGPEREVPRESRTTTMTYAKELISNMWKDFSVEDYIQSDDTDGGTAEKTRKKRKGWVPTITVPEPFQMTLREQKKREKAGSRSDVEMLRALMRKQEEEEAESRKKRFRATPVPSCVSEPMYHDLVRRQEERRRAARDAAKDALLASQKPFKFMAREEQKQAARDQLRELFKPQKKADCFKARPLPLSIYGPAARDQFREEFPGDPGAQEPPQTQPPRGPAARKRRYRKKCKCKRRPRCPTSDVENLPERGQHSLLGNAGSKLRSARDPLDPRAPRDPLDPRAPPDPADPGRERVLTDSQAEDDNFKEARHKSPLKSDLDPPRPTVSSRGREQAIRRSLEEKKMLEEERNRILTKQKQRMKELQKLLITRAKAYDSHESLAQRSKSRIKSLRSEKERRREYRQELEAREEKLTKRPLLFEKVAQKNARMAAERHYSNTLKALGICDEFVSKKGRRGNILEYFSQPEMEHFTEDEGSLHEEKRDERENGEDRDSLDPDGQELCKEEDGIAGESGEENSVD